jgi:hypothetical protein
MSDFTSGHSPESLFALAKVLGDALMLVAEAGQCSIEGNAP